MDSLNRTKIHTSAILYLLLLCRYCHAWIVHTKYGDINGTNPTGPFSVYTFLGIPYAKPPVGELRFEKPQKYPSWKPNILQADTFGSICMQPKLSESYLMTKVPKLRMGEDCLFLNIYVPSAHDVHNSDMKYAVMVFIHGGGFSYGSGAWKDGTPLSRLGDVIVVTLNYRLGLFGFLSSGDHNLPGNLGYHDQNLALKWVHENIAAFTGDNTRITIFGESAGAESVLAHVLSPMSKGLFSGAIVHSTSGARFSIEKSKATPFFFSQAQQFHCNQHDAESVLHCLREMDAFDMIGYTHDSISRVVDGEFLTESPDNIWRSNDYNHVKLMLGFTSDDGRTIFEQMDHPFFGTEYDILYAAPLSVVALDLPYCYLYDYHQNTQPGNEKYVDLVRFEYDTFERNMSQIEEKQIILDVLRDGIFASYSYWVAHQASSLGDDVYMFYFNHRISSLPEMDDTGLLIGATHGEDTLYVFGAPISGAINATEKEKNLSMDMIHAWSHFAKHGKPMQDINGLNPWPKLEQHGGSTPYREWKVVPEEFYNENRPTAHNNTATRSGELVYNIHERKLKFWNHIIVPFVRNCTLTVGYDMVSSTEYSHAWTSNYVVIALAVMCALLFGTLLTMVVLFFACRHKRVYI